MKKFKYKFESIKKVKEIFEKRTQKELSVIQLGLEKLEAEYQKILNQKAVENKKYSRLTTASQVKFHKNYLAFLNEELSGIRKKIDELLIEKEKKTEELIEKSKECKIFDTLEGIHKEDFRIEQNRTEMIEIDEIATQKFTRKNN